MSEVMFVIQNQYGILTPAAAATVSALDSLSGASLPADYLFWQDQSDPASFDFAYDASDLRDLVAKYGIENVVPVGTPEYIDSFAADYMGLRPVCHTPGEMPPAKRPELIASKWRAFVHHGYVVDVRAKQPGTWLAPNFDAIFRIAATVWPNTPAFALDIAMLEDGRTTTDRALTLLGCELYGFESPELPQMLHEAWKHAVTRAAH